MVVGVAYYIKKGDYNMFTIWVHMQIMTVYEIMIIIGNN